MRRQPQGSALLLSIGVAPSRLRLRDAARDGALSVSRAPLRTMLASLGTALAIGTTIATIGLSESAAGAVSGTFNALQATTVTFTDRHAGPNPPDLTRAAEAPLDRLHGVTRAGLLWQVGSQGTLLKVSPVSPASPLAASLPVTAASAAGLAVMGARISAGRLYDAGLDQRRDMVALLGSPAAAQLGITSVSGSPTVYINQASFTVIGIIDRSPRDPGALNGVIVPDSAAAALGSSTALLNRQIVVQTAPGAAQLTGRQGPLAIDPLHPQRIAALVPIDPAQLRASIGASLASLLLAVAVIGLAMGIVAIAITTLLSVSQRRAEIGLRRSVGAAPRHIAVLVLSESGMTGTVGAVIGSSLGIIAISVVCASRGWAAVLAPALLALTPAAGAAAGLLAGLYPAWRASRVSPIQALQR